MTAFTRRAFIAAIAALPFVPSGLVRMAGVTLTRADPDTLALRNGPITQTWNSAAMQWPGSTTSSYPALKRTSSGVIARLADDSGDYRP